MLARIIEPQSVLRGNNCLFGVEAQGERAQFFQREQRDKIMQEYPPPIGSISMLPSVPPQDRAAAYSAAERQVACAHGKRQRIVSRSFKLSQTDGNKRRADLEPDIIWFRLHSFKQNDFRRSMHPVLLVARS